MKKLAKIVGIGIGGYAVFNTLAWTFIGIGRFLNDLRTDEAYKEHIMDDFKTRLNCAFDKLDEGCDKAIDGWAETYGKG